jgi:hypothetical protein
MQKSFLWVAFIAVLIVFVGVLYLRQQNRMEEPPFATLTEEQPAAEPLPPPIRYPIPEPEPVEEEKPLPPLDESDAAVKERFADLFGQSTFLKLFIPDNLIRRIVVTVDNLDRDILPQRYTPFRKPDGTFLVAGQESNLTINPENYKRYAPFVRLAERVDTGKLVSVYVNLYPLFQRAYEDLGYPSKYFNDRLVEVIDHLLDAPEISEPVRLEQPKVVYTFADPELEKLSAGQKILIRIGPDNAKRTKAKLREFRQQLTDIPIDH